MKNLGIIGGLGPESTIDYYRSIIAESRARQGDGDLPGIFINSLDVKKGIALVTANDLPGLTRYLVEAAGKLVRAGSDFALMAANTPHIVFDEVARQVPIPMLSIVQATCDKAVALNLGRLALLGTGFTMQGRFYPEAFARARIQLVVPSADEQAYIHDKYMHELLQNQFLPESREGIMAIIERLRQQEKVEAVILAGTELPLLLREAGDRGIRFLDTTLIHVEAAVATMFS